MDINGETVALGRQRLLSKDFLIEDNQGKKIYSIDENIFSISSKSTIKKLSDTDLDEIDVILYNIIENSIINSKISSSNKSRKSK